MPVQLVKLLDAITLQGADGEDGSSGTVLLLGNTLDTEPDGTIPEGVNLAQQVVGRDNGSVNRVKFYQYGGSGVTMRIGIYSDSGGTPDALLAFTEFDSGGTNPQVFNFPTTPIVAGTTYWICCNSSGATRLYLGSDTLIFTDASNPLPDPFGSINTITTGKIPFGLFEDRGVPEGGTDGQVLTKQSSDDFDIDWETPLSASSTATLTNKTIDANGTGNSISNIEVADLASGVVDTDLSSVSGSDDTIPSAKATKTALDTKYTLQAANVVNDAGADVDQRFEGDTDANLFFVDASTDRVGVGTATPSVKLQVAGDFEANGYVKTNSNLWASGGSDDIRKGALYENYNTGSLGYGFDVKLAYDASGYADKTFTGIKWVKDGTWSGTAGTRDLTASIGIVVDGNETFPMSLSSAGINTNSNINLAENNSVVLDSALSADGKYTGITRAGVAGTTLAFGDIVYLAVADSRWELADADAASTSGDVILGICVLAAAADGDPTTILLYGNVRADTAFPTLTIGAPAYVSTTSGDIQTAQPSGVDDVIRRVGFALTADELMFNPSNDYTTHT